MMVGAPGTDTRALTEGALLAAVTVLLAIVGVFIGYAYMLVPVPLVILVYRHGMNWGIVVGLASALLTGILTALPNTIVVINLGAVGLAIGGMMRERRSPLLTFGVGTLVSMVVAGLSFVITAYLFGINDVNEMIRALEEGRRQAAEITGWLGVDSKMAAQYSELLVQMIKTLVPSLLVLQAAFVTLVSYWVARLLLRRLGENVPWLPPFRTWAFPPALAVVFVAAVAAGLYAPLARYAAVQVAIANISFLLAFLFLLQGLAVAWAWLERWRVAGALRVVLLFFLFYYFSYGVVFLGIIDTWAKFRQRIGSE